MSYTKYKKHCLQFFLITIDTHKYPVIVRNALDLNVGGSSFI